MAVEDRCRRCRQPGTLWEGASRFAFTSGRRIQLVALDHAIHHANGPMRVSGHLGIMGHQDHGDALGVELLEHPQDFDTGVRIEVSRRLVRQQQHGPVDQGAADGHALLLSARHLRRYVMDAVSKTHTHQQSLRQAAGFSHGTAMRRIIQRHDDVLQGRGPCQEIEALKDKPQLLRPHQRPLVGRQAADVLTVEPILARGRMIEAPQDVH